MRDNINVTHFTDSPITLHCGDWQADNNGIYTKEGKLVCPHPILPVERLVNIDNGTEKLKLAYCRDGKWREIVVDCTTCFHKQNIITLADRGIFVTSETAKDLVKYLSDLMWLNMDTPERAQRESERYFNEYTAHAYPIPVSRSIGRLGWIDDEFAPYVDDIHYDGDMDFASLYENIGTKGSREAWFNLMKDLRQNVVIRLMMAASFAGVLVERAGTLPFIFHLWGTTSFGKTVSLMVAMSIWGNPELGGLTRSMNMTTNAMARTAAFLHNLPFAADELQQIKNRWDSYDSMIMYLTEGIDRGRARAHGGGVEEVKTWRNCFIFTGEQPITQENSGGGTKNRVIEVEVTKPLYQSGFHVANTVRDNYGFAGKEYIDYIKQLPKVAIQAKLQLYADEIMRNCDTTDKQAYSMALLLTADHYACEFLFTEETALTVEQIRPYLHSNKTVDVAERAYEWCMNWVAKNSNRFTPIANDVYGKMDDKHVWIVKDVLVQVMHEAGYEFNAVSRKWAESGYLVKNSQGKLMHRTTINSVHTNCVKLCLLPLLEKEV